MSSIAQPSLCHLLPISLRIDVITSFLAEVIANNANGLSVGILVTVDFTVMSNGALPSLPIQPGTTPPGGTVAACCGCSRQASAGGPDAKSQNNPTP
jgi:hypothetical protein